MRVRKLTRETDRGRKTVGQKIGRERDTEKQAERKKMKEEGEKLKDKR